MKALSGDGSRAMTTSSGTRAIHARGESSKFGNEKISRSVVAPAAPHSVRETTCRIADESKNFFLLQQIQSDCEWSISWFLTQKDRIRHCRSDKFRLSLRISAVLCDLCVNTAPFNAEIAEGTQRYAEETLKAGEPSHF